MPYAVLLQEEAARHDYCDEDEADGLPARRSGGDPADGRDRGDEGGLYIPDTAKEKPIQGEVIAVGPGRMEKGQRVPMELKVGDRVVYGKYTGSQVELEEEEIILIKESDVIAKLS